MVVTVLASIVASGKATPLKSVRAHGFREGSLRFWRKAVLCWPTRELGEGAGIIWMVVQLTDPAVEDCMWLSSAFSEVIVGVPEYVGKGVVAGLIKGQEMHVEIVDNIWYLVSPMHNCQATDLDGINNSRKDFGCSGIGS